MSTNRLSIQPVWGDRKMSNGMLETAENLMGNIDELADVLDTLNEKYNTVNEESENKGSNPESPPASPKERDLSMFRKLKACISSTRHLIESLRREKGRLMKREISVECKLGEIEDYKCHVKQDLTSLNELVDLLTIKVCDLEKQLCEEQESSECLNCDKEILEDRLKRAELLLKELNTDNDKLMEENRRLAKERTDVLLKLDNQELKFQNEVLLVENMKLKELLRDKFDLADGDLGMTSPPAITSDSKMTSQKSLPDLIEDKSNNNNNNNVVLINEETVCVRL
ncbi:hypothetical protein ACF0H5_017803 [Mactra antiquata]